MAMSKEDLLTLMNIVPNLDMDDIRRVYSILKDRQSRIQYQTTFKFNAGDRVQFNGKGRMVSGSITKINQKTIKVKADDNVLWTVSPSLLTKIV
jgi:small-conductance mechanosensitive channel